MTLKSLEAYKDENGNEIIFSGKVVDNINIVFRGSNNKLIVSQDVRIGLLHIQFDCDNGRFEIGSSKGGGSIRVHSRVGQDASIRIGNGVSMTGNVYISSVEGTSVVVGDDVMFASGIQVRADDAHPIFDVINGKRINASENVIIGSHVWVGINSSILGGANIGDGTVIGMGSLVNKTIPNNCIAVGAPARVVRKNIAWERPHLSLTKPFYKPDSGTVTKSAFWDLTREDDVVVDVPQESYSKHSLCRIIFDKILRRIGYQRIT